MVWVSRQDPGGGWKTRQTALAGTEAKRVNQVLSPFPSAQWDSRLLDHLPHQSPGSVWWWQREQQQLVLYLRISSILCTSIFFFGGGECNFFLLFLMEDWKNWAILCHSPWRKDTGILQTAIIFAHSYLAAILSENRNLCFSNQGDRVAVHCLMC